MQNFKLMEKERIVPTHFVEVYYNHVIKRCFTLSVNPIKKLNGNLKNTLYYGHRTVAIFKIKSK